MAETMVYDQLRRLAQRFVRGEPLDVTLDATALVHEVYLSLAGNRMPTVRDDGHFIALCARLMRQILVTHARRRRGRRRVHDAHAALLDRAVDLFESRSSRLDLLDESLQRLQAIDERKAAIVELRFFASVPENEIANMLDLSTRTVRREWTLARAWIRQDLDSMTD